MALVRACLSTTSSSRSRGTSSRFSNIPANVSSEYICSISGFVCVGIRRNKRRFNTTDIPRVNSKICLDFAINVVYIMNSFLTDSILVSGRV